MSFLYEKKIKQKNHINIMNAINIFGEPSQEYKMHQFLNSTMTSQRN